MKAAVRSAIVGCIILSGLTAVIWICAITLFFGETLEGVDPLGFWIANRETLDRAGAAILADTTSTELKQWKDVLEERGVLSVHVLTLGAGAQRSVRFEVARRSSVAGSVVVYLECVHGSALAEVAARDTQQPREDYKSLGDNWFIVQAF